MYESLPEWLQGDIKQWQRVASSTLVITWPDGYDTEKLSELLAPAFEFTIVAGANGGPPPRLRGYASAPAANARANVETVDIQYKIGSVTHTQSWKV